MARAARQTREARRESILHAAIALSKTIGYNRITRDAVAAWAGVSGGLVGAYFPRMCDLRTAIMTTAIEQEIVEVIGQGLTINDATALKISEELRTKVMQYISKLK